ncbi:peptide chain release factor N(5)-glutamine methyltransferase [Pararhodobacter oceanensis]|uniref:Release factor glutamine methyltransferase n=1 Tax=Pararhodobacter oceanensis TaxID=2172121 RepID=A0A2T8HW20_9RHOB|nr:peptide chain release factor N(5)-glutamine methyltransferase [Pararhodobacter oceanensis]PVH29631.1 peptide chain release factor N(5)-glutamine methyltransferase [Pararhodobacter oceanensis]
MTPTAALQGAIARLKSAGIPDPARDARLLLAHALGVASDRLTLALHDPFPEDAQQRFSALIEAREARHPVSHLLGRRGFWGRDFIVSRDVLDPRPDTEALIAEALKAPFTKVLDLGTGSGAILLTLLAESPQSQGTGVDLSPAALTVARANADALNLTDRATLTPSDWFTNVTGSFDLIVSNPPYIAEAEIPSLAPEVREHEPHMALTPGGDGLAAYRIIAAQAAAFMTPNARLILEIGPTQGAAVAQLLQDHGFETPRILPDLDQRDRVVSTRLPR